MSKKLLVFLYLTLLIGLTTLHIGNSVNFEENTSNGSQLIQYMDFKALKQMPSDLVTQWSYNYDRGGDDWAYTVVQTMDQGFALVGTSFNTETRDYDFWLIKTDQAGIQLWNESYGTYHDDWAYTAIQTADGGFAIAGTTYSGTSGLGEWDAWLVKTDANGTYLWDQIYGRDSDDEVYGLIQASDGGFVLVGSTLDNETGDSDAWLMKTDTNGDLQWEQIYGGFGDDWGWFVIETMDHGYVFGGSIFNNETETTDAWLAKTDVFGTYLWNQSYGTPNNDEAYAAIETVDGGFALAGSTFNNMTTSSDFWIVRVNITGHYMWNRAYGTSLDEEAYALIELEDGGFVLAGYADTSGENVWDAWSVNIDAVGEFQWDYRYGAEQDTWVEALLQVPGQDFIIAGTMFNNESENYNAWMAKIGPPTEITVSPVESSTTSSIETSISIVETTTSSVELITTSPATITQLSTKETVVPEISKVPPMLIILIALANISAWKTRR